MYFLKLLSVMLCIHLLHINVLHFIPSHSFPQGKGWEVAKSVYPDSILDQIPSHLILQIQVRNYAPNYVRR